jgi:hypothetical protein
MDEICGALEPMYNLFRVNEPTMDNIRAVLGNRPTTSEPNKLSILSTHTLDSVRQTRLEKCRANIEAAIRSRRVMGISLVILGAICKLHARVGDNATRGARYSGLLAKLTVETKGAQEALRLLSELESSIRRDAMSPQTDCPDPSIEEALQSFENFIPQWLQLTEPLMNEIRVAVPICL